MTKPQTLNYFLPNAKATMKLGAQFAVHAPRQLTIYLCGPLGAGKTTFVQGFLKAMGYQGIVKSPTYGLVETYEVQDKKINHFDLYRLTDASELEYIGIRDYSDHAINLIEWPEQGEGYLMAPDIVINFRMQGTGRVVDFHSATDLGRMALGVILAKVLSSRTRA